MTNNYQTSNQLVDEVVVNTGKHSVPKLAHVVDQGDNETEESVLQLVYTYQIGFGALIGSNLIDPNLVRVEVIELDKDGQQEIHDITMDVHDDHIDFNRTDTDSIQIVLQVPAQVIYNVLRSDSVSFEIRLLLRYKYDQSAYEHLLNLMTVAKQTQHFTEALGALSAIDALTEDGDHDESE